MWTAALWWRSCAGACGSAAVRSSSRSKTMYVRGDWVVEGGGGADTERGCFCVRAGLWHVLVSASCPLTHTRTTQTISVEIDTLRATLAQAEVDHRRSQARLTEVRRGRAAVRVCVWRWWGSPAMVVRLRVCHTLHRCTPTHSPTHSPTRVWPHCSGEGSWHPPRSTCGACTTTWRQCARRSTTCAACWRRWRRMPWAPPPTLTWGTTTLAPTCPRRPCRSPLPAPSALWCLRVVARFVPRVSGVRTHAGCVLPLGLALRCPCVLRRRRCVAFARSLPHARPRADLLYCCCHRAAAFLAHTHTHTHATTITTTTPTTTTTTASAEKAVGVPHHAGPGERRHGPGGAPVERHHRQAASGERRAG